MEHYHTTLTKDNVKEILANSFILIRDFLTLELVEEPLEILGEECWNTLLSVSEVYEKEKAECASSLKKVKWKYSTLKECTKYFRCPECHSSLVRTDESGDYTENTWLMCASCGNEFFLGDIIEFSLEDMFGGEAYIAAKEGIEPPLANCPACTKDTFVYTEGLCVVCEDELMYQECKMCDEPLSLDEQCLEGYCSYCSHKIEKMNAE